MGYVSFTVLYNNTLYELTVFFKNEYVEAVAVSCPGSSVYVENSVNGLMNSSIVRVKTAGAVVEKMYWHGVTDKLFDTLLSFIERLVGDNKIVSYDYSSV